MTDVTPERGASAAIRRPRLGFLGVGWIGRSRMEAMLATGAVEAVGLVEPSDEMAGGALSLAPAAERVSGLDDLLDRDLDGLVIATPSALHAEQAIQALERGVAVFCQKPLGRTAVETRAVVDAARSAGQLLGVDMSYRFTEGVQAIRRLVQQGDLGSVHAIDLTFHNAYGPDKPWFYDVGLSGGGCVMDLGVHLVDLGLWLLDHPKVVDVASNLFAGGEPLKGREAAEDFAIATVTLEPGAVVRLACSWRLPVGQDAVIAVDVFGRNGGAALRNVHGSFYDFVAERFRGTARAPLAAPPDAWGGRAAVDWARRLAAGAGFDPAVEHMIETAAVLDAIYARAP